MCHSRPRLSLSFRSVSQFRRELLAELEQGEDLWRWLLMELLWLVEALAALAALAVAGLGLVRERETERELWWP